MRKVLSVLAAILVAIPLLSASPRQPASSHHVHSSLSQPVMAVPPVTQVNAGQGIVINFGGTLGLVYDPQNTFILPGDSLTWMGDFSSHPLVSDEALWTMVSTGTMFTFTFNTPGVYHFHCFFHGSLGMNGTVSVGYRDFLPLVDK